MSSAEPTPALTKEEKEEQHKQAVGEANFEAAKSKADGLSALRETEEGQQWLRALVPKNDEEGADLNERLNECLQNPDAFKKEHYKTFKSLLDNAKTFYAEKRVKIYESVLKDKAHGEEVRQQLCTLAGTLDDTFKRGYANIFETWIQVGDTKGLDGWTELANEVTNRLNENKEKMTADVTEMRKLYKDACNGELIREYEDFFTRVAAETGGTFCRADMKSPLRATEKTAFRYDPDRRFKCDNVYDVLRGAIEYPDMESFTKGAKMICESEQFTALKLKDRMTQGKETSSGWRDAMINGKFDDIDTHVVEIQLHHKKLVSIREDLGGHFLYSIYRSIIEALEVVFGEERTQEMIEEYAPPKVNNGEQSGEIVQLRTENRRLNTDNKELTADNSKLKTDIGRLTTDNKELAADNSKLKTDISKLTSDISKLTSDISNLTSDISNLTSDNSNLTSDNSRLNTHNSKLTSENKELKNEIDNLKKQMHEQQGSSSSPTPSNDQWHVVLLNWFREFTDESKHAGKFKPRYPKSKEDLLALTKVDLCGCDLKGPIPKEFGLLQKLKYLGLDENQLTGPIPGELGQLQKLTHLYLNHNQLTGPIPKEIGQLQQLTVLSLWGNQLTVPENAPLDIQGDMCYDSNEKVKNFWKCLSK